MEKYINAEALEKAVFIKRDEERKYWIEYLEQHRSEAGYSEKEKAVDNWLRGYGEAVENLLAIIKEMPPCKVERCGSFAVIKEGNRVCLNCGKVIEQGYICESCSEEE